MGKFSLSQISQILNEARRIPSISWIYFGGGEPFTQYPLLLKAVQRARKKGFNVGVATNGYFARTVETGVRLLRPLAQMGVKNIRISNDDLHYKNPWNSPALRTLKAARDLGLEPILVQVKQPGKDLSRGYGVKYATFVDERRLMFCGRAAETITEKMPRTNWRQFDCCPRKDLCDPEEIFIDAYGYLQICPGIAIGNIWDNALHIIVRDYDPEDHPIMNLLLVGGPAALARANKLQTNSDYIEPCHFCYSTRRELIDKHQNFLAPRQVYGY